MNSGGEMLRLLDQEGRFDRDAAGDLDLKDKQLLELFRLMLLTRRADLEATALQRQGELAVYPPLIGQEAAQIGSAFALEPRDFVFPSYRELGVALTRGIDLVDYLQFYRGTWHGGMYDPLESRFGMVAVPIASQLPHAVGFAYGAKLKEEPIVTVAYFGDGATSQGDFHEACNFASVYKVPVVFFCQNNQWAISVPVVQQTVAPIYKKAKAYGFPGVLVDGNDVLACYLATKQATERARSEGMPTLVEAVTYRLGPHSTADDAGRYQPREEIEKWTALDPIERYRKFLVSEGLLTDEIKSGFDADANKLAAYIRKGIVGAPSPVAEELFSWVFAEKSRQLLAQEKAMFEQDDESV